MFTYFDNRYKPAEWFSMRKTPYLKNTDWIKVEEEEEVIWYQKSGAKGQVICNRNVISKNRLEIALKAILF